MENFNLYRKENVSMEQNGNKLVKLLRKIFNAKIIGILIAIIAAIAAVIAVWPRPKGEIVLENIQNNIKIIETTFKPFQIQNPDSIKLVENIRHFESKSLELCALWNKQYYRPSYDVILDYNPDNLFIVLDQDSENLQKVLNIMSDITTIITEIYSEDITEKSNTSYINYNRLVEINELLKKKKDVCIHYHEKCMSYMRSHMNVNMSQSQKIKHIKRGLKYYDERDKSAEYLELDDKVFELIVETKKFNDLRLNL